MVVRCIRTSIPNVSPKIINSELEEYLKTGADYEVYGIRIFNGINYYMIFDDGHLIEVPSLLFDIIEGQVSPLWIVNCSKDKEITFWPKLFYDQNFFENFSEWEDFERDSFAKLKQLFKQNNEASS